MLLATYPIKENGQYKMWLCIIPHKFCDYVPAIKVDDLKTTDYAVQWVGPGEGVTVKVNAEERAKVIEAMRPAVLYITPPTESQPGVKVHSVKVVYHDDRYEVLYSRDGQEDWKPFNPNIPRGAQNSSS